MYLFICCTMYYKAAAEPSQSGSAGLFLDGGEAVRDGRGMNE
jgi:hypothetical protein